MSLLLINPQKLTRPKLNLHLTNTLLLTFALCVGSVAASAQAANVSGPTPQLKKTKITEIAHPFETLYCARQPIQYRYIGQALEVVVNNDSRMLLPAISASGARYVSPDDADTEFWSKGAIASVTWSGQALPQCAPVGTMIPPYRASGNEPFWTLDFTGWEATLTQPGQNELTQDAQIVATTANGQTLQAGEGKNVLQLQVKEALCFDSMSGMPHPQHATLQYQSKEFQGCGGNPERLLQGATWKITELPGQATSTKSPASLQFLANNKVAGSTGCNRFFGQYTLTGEGLSFNGLGSTRMACAPAQMTQEATFLKLLNSVNGFSFDTIRTLILKTSEGDIKASLD